MHTTSTLRIDEIAVDSIDCTSIHRIQIFITKTHDDKCRVIKILIWFDTH